MKWIDLPPVWLAACAAVVWFTPKVPAYVPAQAWVGALFVLAGLILMGLAVWEMVKHRTTVVPHMTASALVQTGIFARSRNPIYLGDVLVLAGLILRWNAHAVAWVLIPLFIWVITKRFIQPEEARLTRHFGESFTDYANATRRWV